jgi:hypothetical protein
MADLEGLMCLWCHEPITGAALPLAVAITDGEGAVSWRHQACAVRQVVGSVAHQQRCCSCYGGTDADDDDGLSARLAAEAALAYWRAHGGRR